MYIPIQRPCPSRGPRGLPDSYQKASRRLPEGYQKATRRLYLYRDYIHIMIWNKDFSQYRQHIKVILKLFHHVIFIIPRQLLVNQFTCLGRCLSLPVILDINLVILNCRDFQKTTSLTLPVQNGIVHIYLGVNINTGKHLATTSSCNIHPVRPTRRLPEGYQKASRRLPEGFQKTSRRLPEGFIYLGTTLYIMIY